LGWCCWADRMPVGDGIAHAILILQRLDGLADLLVVVFVFGEGGGDGLAWRGVLDRVVECGELVGVVVLGVQLPCGSSLSPKRKMRASAS
jgi:hypothetical protein